MRELDLRDALHEGINDLVQTSEDLARGEPAVSAQGAARARVDELIALVPVPAELGAPPHTLDESTRDEVRDALQGDSNDAEHDALVSVADALGIEWTSPYDAPAFVTVRGYGSIEAWANKVGLTLDQALDEGVSSDENDAILVPTDVYEQTLPPGLRLARQHFLRIGYQVIAEQFPTRWGTLDLIAHGHGALVFCDVAIRRVPNTDVAPTDRARIRRMAAAWLSGNANRPRCEALRFDAVSVVLDEASRLVDLHHTEAAF